MKTFIIFYQSCNGPGYNYSETVKRPHFNAAKMFALKIRRNPNDSFYINVY